MKLLTREICHSIVIAPSWWLADMRHSPCHQWNVDHCCCLTLRSDDSRIKTLHVLSPVHFMGRLPCSRINRSLFIHSVCLYNWEKWPGFLLLCYFKGGRGGGHLQGLLHSALSNFISPSLNAEQSKAVSESSSLITFHFSCSQNEHCYYLSKLSFYVWSVQVLKNYLWFLRVLLTEMSKTE